MRLRYNQTVDDVGGRETKTFLKLEMNLLLASLLDYYKTCTDTLAVIY